MPGPQPGPLRQTLLTEARALMDPGLSTGKTVTKKTVQDKYEEVVLKQVEANAGLQEKCAGLTEECAELHKKCAGLKERDSRHQEEMRQQLQLAEQCK